MNWVIPTIAAGVVPLGYFGLRAVYDDIYERMRVWQDDQIELHGKAQRQALENLMHIPADERGRLGMVVRSDGSIVNMDTRTVLDSDWRVKFIDPVMERMDHIERLLLASPGVSSPERMVLPEPEHAPIEVCWPEMIYLDEVSDGSHSLHNLVLGVVPTDDGRMDAVRGDLSKLVHLLIASRSGWGKSKLLQTLVYQLALANDCDLALVDYGVNTFARLQSCRSLLYPVADTPGKAIALFGALLDEMESRRERFKAYPEAEHLADYNRLSNEPLRPIVCLCDEGTQLATKDGIKEPLTALLQQARKFGVWVCMAGQNWKASILPTEIRDNFSSRIAMHTSPPTSRIMIDSADATDLPVPGRAIALLPGRAALTMHIPVVRNWDKLPQGEPRADFGPVTEPDRDSDLRQRVIEVWDSLDRPSVTKVTSMLFDGQRGGSHWDDVKEIVYSEGLE